MGNMTWLALRELLSVRYDDFRARLTRRLGSEELASESLNETWLRLHRQDDAGVVQSPIGYVLQMAVNIATDHRRAESRRARRSETRAALEIPDPAPGPAREAEARLQLEALHHAIETLPERTREILIAARLQERPQADIADRFGITPRMVRIELRRALDHCEAYLEKNATVDFPSGLSQTSTDRSQRPRSVPGTSEKDSAG
jgi:RNA polymerase sigma factor (sigma-70 family)